MSEIQCPVCQVVMEKGFVLDHSYGSVIQSKWIEGPPERSFWTGIKTSGRRLIPPVTYRCQTCGLLQSYARLSA